MSRPAGRSISGSAVSTASTRISSLRCRAHGSGSSWSRSRASGELYPLVEGRAVPLAEVEAAALAESHQTWALERAAGVWRVDLFREPSAGATWIARRDESIRLPYEDLIRFTAEGIPYARPEVAILFKAKHTRAKDDADFAAVLPRLGEAERRWLADALARVHPGHRWLDELV